MDQDHAVIADWLSKLNNRLSEATAQRKSDSIQLLKKLDELKAAIKEAGDRQK